jgi:phosphoribosyl 1,2-cyclic phosphate phosphodiesterase
MVFHFVWFFISVRTFRTLLHFLKNGMLKGGFKNRMYFWESLKIIVLKVTFLGTGTSQGVPVVACPCRVCQSDNERDKRLRSSVLVEVEGVVLVIDAGPDFRQQMLRAHVHSIDGILLTHEHYDHISGLDDIRAFNWVQKHATDIYAEQRVHQSVKQIFAYVFAANKYPGIPQMNLHEVSSSPFCINGVEVVPIRAWHHKLPVLGFKIGDFAYLTDIKTISETEREKIRNIKVLVINALRKEEHLSHLNLKGALEIIDDLQAENAFITHISHQFGLYDEENPLLPKNVELSYDGLCIEF